MSDIVVFSPSRFSLYTISVTELLLRNHIEVKTVFVRKLANPSRFLTEFSRDGSRLIRKLWKKLILQKKAYTTVDYETIVDFMKKENILFKKVDEFEARYGIPVVYCNDLNDPPVVARLKAIRPALIVFTGGGLIRQEVLALSGAGILNCHAGVLPPYRGMDVIEWAVLENALHEIGMTVHFMDKGVDTGDILRVRRVELGPKDALRHVRDHFEPLMCREMVSACLDYLGGKTERIPQRREAGKQYFMMHPLLIRLAEAKLEESTTKIQDVAAKITRLDKVKGQPQSREFPD